MVFILLNPLLDHGHAGLAFGMDLQRLRPNSLFEFGNVLADLVQENVF